MKKDKMIYWAATGIIFLFDTVMPALTSHTELAKQGIAHLGYPDYFRIQLTVFKIIGGRGSALAISKFNCLKYSSPQGVKEH
jgi:hypothetical protein